MGLISDLFSKEKSCRLLVNLESSIAEKYKWYREFLIHNHEALHIISDLELLHEDSEPFTLTTVKNRYDRLAATTRNLVDALNNLADRRYEELSDVCRTLCEETEKLFTHDVSPRSKDLVLPLELLREDMAWLAGSKATNLATLGNVLGLPIPPGFVVTTNAFRLFMEENALVGPIDDMLTSLSSDAPNGLESTAKRIQEKILQAPVPPALAESILRAYGALEEITQKGVPIAMRSTAVGEDTEASFAGQYTTRLNVGKQDLLEAYKTVVASKYSPRAVLYRMRCGLDDRSTPMAVAGIMMIPAKSSGVVYSADPSKPASLEMLVTATWGLGEYLVSGEASPVTY